MKDMKEKLRDMENRMRKFKLNLIVVRKQQLELDMEQQTASKSGKECIKAVYCHPANLTYMHSTTCEMPGWMKHKLKSRFQEKHQ